MTVATLSLNAFLGEDYQAVGQHLLSEGGAAVDITGWSLVFTIRHHAGSAGPPLLQFDVTLTAPVTGQYVINLSSAQLSALGVGDYAIDLWRADTGAQAELAIGWLTVLQPVTHQADF